MLANSLTDFDERPPRGTNLLVGGLGQWSPSPHLRANRVANSMKERMSFMQNAR